MNNCEICAFENPKATVTAVIIRRNKILLVKRGEDPFKGKWDLPGGYVHKKESPENTLRREIKEELKIIPDLKFIKTVTGTSFWNKQKFPIISFFYLAEIGDKKITLGKEITKYKWMAIKDLEPQRISFDSNQTFCQWMKKNFYFDLKRIGELVRQLDPTAKVGEYSLYRASLEGYLSQRYDGNKLIGMGWIFPRQTMLRRQAVVEDMIVDEKYRGKGLGKEILLDLLEWARSQKVEVVELTTNPLRVAANELYRKVGFRLHSTNHYLLKIKN